MAVLNLVQAINQALDQKMEDDGRVVIFGEDSGFEGGVFRVTAGLQKKYGEEAAKRMFNINPRKIIGLDN